jgi:phage terminase large subunit-like protein
MIQVKPRHDKAARAYVVQPLLQRGVFHLNTADRNQQHLLDEMLMFTGLDDSLFPDDCVDALVHGLTYMYQNEQLRRAREMVAAPPTPVFSHTNVRPGGWA